MDRNLPATLRLVVRVPDELPGQDLAVACQEAQVRGATAILLGGVFGSARELGREARSLLARIQVPLLLRGRPDVAIAVGAAGVHLGSRDTPATLVRRIAPRGFLIGATVEAPQDVENGRGADYWVIPWSSEGTGRGAFSSLARRAEGRPCVAVGAATENLGAVLDAGAVGILLRKRECET
jgi:thiamine-phosphate pyrophosphorylase